MDDPIFDAIFALCNAADDEGFTFVADALELVLDVYLLEREQMNLPEPMFRSKRAERQRELVEWVADSNQDLLVGWSMNTFPLQYAV